MIGFFLIRFTDANLLLALLLEKARFKGLKQNVYENLKDKFKDLRLHADKVS